MKTCPQHRRYDAVRKPTSHCRCCWDFWQWSRRNVPVSHEDLQRVLKAGTELANSSPNINVPSSNELVERWQRAHGAFEALDRELREKYGMEPSWALKIAYGPRGSTPASLKAENDRFWAKIRARDIAAKEAELAELKAQD